MRRKLAAIALIMAIIFWIGSFLADPYTSWGIENEQVRPSVASLSVGLAAIAVFLALASSFAAFWGNTKRGGIGVVAVALTLLFIGSTGIARIVWIKCYVLA